MKSILTLLLCAAFGFGGCGAGRDATPPAADKPAEMSDFEGVWYSWNGEEKLRIQSGFATGWFQYKGRYEKSFLVKVKLEDGCLVPANDRDMLGGYREFRREGKLLIGVSGVEVLDGPSPEDTEFAREGHEDELTPEPVYVKEASQVEDRRIERFSLSLAACRDGKLFLSAWEGFEGAEEASFCLSNRPDGRRVIEGGVSRMDWAAGRKVSYGEAWYDLTPETEEKLAALLLRPEVLECNPYEDSSDMMAPTTRFRLSAKLASGQEIDISTNYGVPIGEETCGEIVRLLLDGAPERNK